MENRYIFSKRLNLLIKYKENMNSLILANELEVTAALITKYTKGKSSPSFENLIKIADIFNVSVDYLVGKSNTFHPNIDYSHFITNWCHVVDSLTSEEQVKGIEFLRCIAEKIEKEKIL
ncbi:putative transcriptional regulator [Bacillus sp. TS-2]|nr:putative transcriptional regulator [Bacillus sp. TS-2]